MSRILGTAAWFAFAVVFSQIAAAADPPISETYPIDVTIAQNQPLEIVRPNFFDPKHQKLLTLSGVLAGPQPGSLAISFDWIDVEGVKHNSPVQEFPFSPGAVNQVSMEYIVPFCPSEVSVDFRLANADVVRFVGEFKHECLVPEPSSLVLGGLCAVLAIGTRRKR
jgi:PEP-CTERM motif